MATESVRLVYGGQEHVFPVVVGSTGEKAIDISRLRQQTGLVTLDPGLANTASCTSTITFVDGERGVLRYRGIPVERFVERPNFIEVAYLLIFGQQPDRATYGRFSEMLSRHSYLHEGMRHHFQGFPNNSPPMAMLSAMLNVLACYHPEFLRIDNEDALEEAAARLISKVRTIAAYSFRHAFGRPVIYSDPTLSYCANFLHMMFSEPYRRYGLDDEAVEALNILLILHADHEQNASTSTVRVVGSSRANLFTSVAAGVSSLWGDLHGGANAAVMAMLEEIQRGGTSIDTHLERAKRKDGRLMGFGHRVYKSYDPRAKILQGICARLTTRLRPADPLIDTARRLEERVLADPYFTERNLYPNVDFYSGIIMRMLGIPTSMFPVIFAIGRLPGWIAHWHEQHIEQTSRIFRPRQIYIGPAEADYLEHDARTATVRRQTTSEG
jgi:citrate synthase